MGAIGVHHTETTDESWDAGMMMGRMGDEPGKAKLRQMHAWVDPEGDPGTKAAYKFPHHMCGMDGAVGAANMTACSAAIASLNGARGGAKIPDADRAGGHAHLAAHLKDGDREAPDLRSYEGEPDADPVQQALKDGLAGLEQAAAEPAVAVKLTAVAGKAETETHFTLAGWAVVYGGQDLTGETVTKDTDFWLDRLGRKKVLLYDHGFDDAVQTKVIGEAEITEQEDGLWFEAQLEKANKYAQQVLRLARAGVLGASTGAIAHLVRGEETPTGYVYKSWPFPELSLTVTPAEHRTLGVDELKALVREVEALRGLLPEAAGEAAEQVEGQAASS